MQYDFMRIKIMFKVHDLWGENVIMKIAENKANII